MNDPAVAEQAIRALADRKSFGRALARATLLLNQLNLLVDQLTDLRLKLFVKGRFKGALPFSWCGEVCNQEEVFLFGLFFKFTNFLGKFRRSFIVLAILSPFNDAEEIRA